MENEIQKRRTYEIIGKWIARQSGVTINFNEEGKVQCDPKTKRIDLPSNVKAENIYPALAWLMHEAAHIRHTTFDHEPITKNDKTDFSILNAVEDVRIDRHNMNELPNIRGFYTEMVKFLDMPARIKGDAPIEVKVLSDAILIAENFEKYSSRNPDIRKFIDDTGLISEMEKLVWMLERLERKENCHGEAKKQVKVIRDILTDAQRNKQLQQSQGQGQGAGSKTGKDAQGLPSGNGQSGGGGNAKGNGLDLDALGNVTGGGVSRAIFGELSKSVSNSSALGEAALQEHTKSNFRELLNQKETQRISDGEQIDTDNLLALLTGDIEELFKEEVIVRHKKSKLLILLDSSGSMWSPLLDGNDKRSDTVAKTAKSITNILDEVQMIEGLNVDYEVSRFDSAYYKLGKDTWQKEYAGKIGGGTNLQYAFDQAMEGMLKDPTIEGKRMIVLITDGEVDGSQIEHMQRSISKNNADVRAMVIGCGAEINGQFVKKISGHNIIASDHADIVLMECIQEMME